MRAILASMDNPDDVLSRPLTKAIYDAMIDQHRPAPPRVESASPAAAWPTVWSRVASKVLPAEVRAAWFRAVHDVIPTATRRHAIGRAASPLCARCAQPDTEPDTLLHRLTRCSPAARCIWRWVAAKVTRLTGVSDDTGTVLLVPEVATTSAANEMALVWVLGTTVAHMLKHPTLTVPGFVTTMLRAKKAVQCSGNQRLGQVLEVHVK